MKILVYTVLGSLLCFLLFYKFVFLRDNKNQIPPGDNVVSPASGKIINIQKIVPRDAPLKIKKGFLGHIRTTVPQEKEYYLVNVFMNVYNVHFTKSPVDGELLEITRRDGKFLPVFDLENALQNEKQEFVLDTKYGLVKVIQISGFLARRCVSFVDEGANLKKGENMGQILLGSQVALLIPGEGLELKAKVGDRVSSGETILFEPKQK